jgi:hypothetical protein
MARYRPKAIFNGNNDFSYIIDVQFQLDAFREYIQMTEGLIEQEVKQTISKYEKYYNDSLENGEGLVHDLGDHEVKKNIQSLYYSSLFISIYSFLEKKMFQLCLIGGTGQNLKVEDLAGRGIDKFKNYITKVLNVDLRSVQSDWETIQKLNVVRNLLVHHPTDILDKRNYINKINILKTIKHLQLVEHEGHFEFAIVNKDLLLSFLSHIYNFLNELYYERVLE